MPRAQQHGSHISQSSAHSVNVHRALERDATPEVATRRVKQLRNPELSTLEFGVSNFMPHQVNMLKQYVPISYNQIELSVICLSPFTNGILDNCMENKITPMAWAPLGGRMLTDDLHPHFRSITHTAAELAEKYATGMNEILLSFLHTHPSGIITVIGTTKPERLEQAKKASNIRLTREDWFALFKAATGEDVA